MSPPDPLLKLAKIVRSQQHAQTLQEQQTTLYGSDDHGVVADFHSEPGYLIVKAFSWVSPPAEWSLIIGEALYQFRSTLDHLVCERTEANGQTVDSGVEFPIFDKPEKFRKPDGNLTWKADRNIGRLSF